MNVNHEVTNLQSIPSYENTTFFGLKAVKALNRQSLVMRTQLRNVFQQAVVQHQVTKLFTSFGTCNAQ